MHISILQENLLKALTRTGRVVSTKPQLPILQSVLIQTKKEDVTLTSSNLEVTTVTHIGGKIQKEGGICVPNRLLTEFVSSLPMQTVELTVEEGALHVSCGRFHASLPGVAASEFPPVPEVASSGRTKLDKNIFIETIQRIVFAAATDDSRPLLTGIKIFKKADMTTFLATDGYRLSWKEAPLSIKWDINLVIPSRALLEVMKLCQEDKEAKELSFLETKEGQLAFIIADTELFTRRIDGEFPNVDKIIPKTSATTIRVDREEFTQAVKSASVFARDNANIIRFHIEPKLLTVSANTPNIGENKVEVEVKSDGEGGDIAFNSRFLLELLGNIHGEEVTFGMTGSLNPGVFRISGDDSFFHIIMPVRVQS